MGINAFFQPDGIQTISPVPLDTPAPAPKETTPAPSATPQPETSATPLPAETDLAAAQSPQITNEVTLSPSPQPGIAGMITSHNFTFGALTGAALVAVIAALIAARAKKRRRLRGKAALHTGQLPEGVEIGNAHHIGCRSNQEDAFAISDLNNARLVGNSGVLAVVADGMGGLADGELVSAAASGAMMREFPLLSEHWTPQQKLLYLVERANDAANAVTGGAPGHGGSTLVAALVCAGRLWFASVGDSRVCLVRGGALVTLSRPHVFEADLDRRAAKGDISFETASLDAQRGALTSYVGMGELDAIDYSPRAIQLLAGDWVLLMTDGVFNALGDDEIACLLQGDAQTAVERLQNRVLSKGNPQQDNMTVVALRIV